MRKNSNALVACYADAADEGGTMNIKQEAKRQAKTNPPTGESPQRGTNT